MTTGLEEGLRAYLHLVDPSGAHLQTPSPWDAQVVLDEIVPRAQHMVGELWESGAWSVAQEHAATEMAAKIVDQLSESVPSASPGRRVLVTCAEGEWHALAGVSLATSFALRGWQVRTVRPATKAAQVAAQLHDYGAHVLAITCSMNANLPGARRMIAGAVDTGTPTIVGGQAFGVGEARARMLGASAWAATTHGAVDIARTLDTVPPGIAPLQHELAAEFATLRARFADVARSLSAQLALGSPDDIEIVELSAWTVRNLAAALMCNDPTIMGDYMAWLRRRPRRNGGPDPSQITAAVDASLPKEMIRSRELLAG